VAFEGLDGRTGVTVGVVVVGCVAVRAGFVTLGAAVGFAGAGVVVAGGAGAAGVELGAGAAAVVAGLTVVVAGVAGGALVVGATAAAG